METGRGKPGDKGERGGVGPDGPRGPFGEDGAPVSQSVSFLSQEDYFFPLAGRSWKSGEVGASRTAGSARWARRTGRTGRGRGAGRRREGSLLLLDSRVLETGLSCSTVRVRREALRCV